MPLKNMLPKEYQTLSELAGPLIMVEKTTSVMFDELVEIQL